MNDDQDQGPETMIGGAFGDAHKRQAETWFGEFRDRLTATLESLEDRVDPADPVLADIAPGRFRREGWSRDDISGDGGGGTMALLRDGRMFEKAGVNVSTVWGEFSEEFRGKVPGAAEDPRFWASGVSVVVHPRNPHVPAAHMNTRMIVTTQGWFGGGGDLTPVFPDAAETERFHAAYRDACERHPAGDYPRFKAWCDDYFYLPHRGEARGVGGIFFDNLCSVTGDDPERAWNGDFAFVQDVAQAFLDAYPSIVAAKMNCPWSDADRQAQLAKRGRYVEFNLLYDRGTLFGLKTGGNTDAILMSLPPAVAWP